MKRLSQTWKQKKSVKSTKSKIANDKFSSIDRFQNEKSAKVFHSRSTNKTSTTLQQTTKKQETNNDGISTNNSLVFNSPTSSLSVSFGFDFDAAALSEMDKLEQEHGPSSTTPIPHKRRLTENLTTSTPQNNRNEQKPTVTTTLTTTPQATLLFSKRNDSITPKTLSEAPNRAVKGRERISTPIEENSNALVSPSANLPVFSPVNLTLNCSVSESLRIVQRHETDGRKESNRNLRLSKSGSSSDSTHDSDSSTSNNVLEVCPASGSDVLNLESWGLPPSVLQRYHDMGITHMFEWQAECLRTGNVLKGGNLVYSAPTSAGKTMVAELLMLKRVLETKRKALFILPYVSVAREKMFYLQRLFQEASVRVEGFMGSHNPAGGFAAVDIAVCTIEKANSLLNRLMEENKVSTLGVVVVDEMHMIGDPHRGYLLELFLTKIRFVTGEDRVQVGQAECDDRDGKPRNESPIQIVCMSATLPNLDILARWLAADLYFTDHRPVPLTEMVKVGQTIYDKQMNKIRDIDPSKAVVNDDDHIIPLCKETITQGHSVLIFCPTKNWCEKQAEAIARHFSTIGNPGLARTTDNRTGFVKASDLIAFDYEAIREVFEQLKRTPVGLDSVLRRVLPYAVAYHHAGLTVDERDIIEGAFRQGTIRVLVATSTLCSGVNLPARRVIIRTPTFHGKMVDPLVYKQMAGRAGRKGVDDLGESVLVCKTTERHKATTLMKSELKPVQSCLLLKELNGGIKRALLEVIASGVVTGLRDVERYAACTFFASSSRESDSDGNKCAITETIKFLVDNEFIRVQVNKDGKDKGEDCRSEELTQERYVPTQLGSATVASALSPDEALVVFGDLQQARKCFVLESELHIIYQVTPIYVEAQWPNLDWNQFLSIWERLPSHMRRVADIVGIQEAYLSLASRGRIPTRTPQQRQQLRVHRRFFAALALQDLVREVPLNVVARRYGATRGMVQSLQSSASTFAGMVTVFCQKLGWVNLDLLLSQFQSRLSFGVGRELCDLVRISVLNAARARMIYNAGFQTMASLASAKPEVIETVLRNAAPFVSERRHHGETELEVKHRSEARVIWVAGKKGLSEREAAVLIISEAKQHLQSDVAQLGIQWKAPEINPPEVRAPEINPPEAHAPEINPPDARATVVPGTSIRTRENQSVRLTGNLSQGKSSKKKRRFSNRRKLSGTNRNRTSPPLRRSPRRSPDTNPPTVNEKCNTLTLPSCLDGQKNGVKDDRTSQNIQILESRPGTSKEKCAIITNPKRMALSSCMEVQENKVDTALKVQPVEFAPAGASKIPSHEKNRLQSDIQQCTKTLCCFETEDVTHPKQGNFKPLPQEKKLVTMLKTTSSNVQTPSGKVPTTYVDIQTFSVKAQAVTSLPNVAKQSERQKSLVLEDAACLMNTNEKNSVRDHHAEEHLDDTWKERDQTSTNPSKACQEVDQSEGRCFNKRVHECHHHEKRNDFCTPIGNPSTHRKTSPRNKSDNEASANRSSIKRRSPRNEVRDDSPKEKIPRIEPKMSDRTTTADMDKQDFLLNTTQSFSVQEESCSSGVLFDNSIDTSENIVAPGPSVSPELYSEPLDEENDAKADEVPESQALGFSMSDSYLAQCGGLTQTNPEDHRHQNKIDNEQVNHLEQYDVSSSISDDIMALNCEGILEEIGDNNGQEDPLTMNCQEDSLSVNDQENPLGIDIQQDPLRINVQKDPLRVSAQEGHKRQHPHKVKYGQESRKNEKERAHEFNDDQNIVGEFDSGGHFQRETCTSGPCSPVNTCGLTSSSRPSSSDERGEGENDGFLELTGSFSLNLSLSGSPFDDNCDIDPKPKTHPSEKVEDPSHEGLRTDKHSLERDTNNSELNLDGGRRYKEISAKACSSKEVQNSRKSTVDEGLLFDLDGHDPDHVFPDTAKNNVKYTMIKSKGINSIKQQTPSNIKESRNSVFVVNTPEVFQSPRSDEASDSSSGSPVNNTPASPSCTFSTVAIVDISANELLFHHFIKEWKGRKEFAIAIGSERVLDNVPKIGGRFKKAPKMNEWSLKGISINGTDEAVVGIAVSWGGRDAYYISLKDYSEAGGPDESLVASTLPIATRIEGIKSVLEYKGKRKGMKFCFDSAAHYKALAQSCGITLSGDIEDPKVAAWLLDPSAKEKSLHHLAAEFISDKTDLLEGTGAGFGCGSLGLTSQSPMGGRARACTEAVVTYWLMKQLRDDLKKVELEESFYQVEMPVMKCLARMELNGIGFSEVECERLKSILQAKLRSLEETAYKLANRSFSLTSPDDVATVLFLELKLPVDGKLEDNGPTQVKRRTLGSSRRAPRGRKQLKHLSTNKDVLERLKQFHPLPAVILEWRRVNCALTKVVYPVQREKMINPRVNMNRIYTTSQIHTATGRVSFAEPNLQNVPRDFEIDLPQEARRMSHVTNTISVSMRNTFVPFEGGVMLAADYSQLELRLIAHLSTDLRLIKLLNAGGDVFKMIAGSLNGVEPTAVNDVQRQQAKQICYGIIYGIGAKSLGEQLKVSEEDASVFIEKFKSRFSGIKKYLKSTVENCRKDGFVLTVTKRRRYLPGINSTNMHARSQAERQAVNTTVQGSAADLVKIAMINIDQKLSEMYPTTRTTHRHKTMDQNGSESTSRRRSTRISAQTPRKITSAQPTKGAFVVLQLHDELILEVSEGDLHGVAAMIKKEMETAMKLSVVLPVKLKAGPSWGTMNPLEL